MEQIYEPNDQFHFDKLVLSTPIYMNAGSYFIKYLFQDSPLYIQAPKCTTKQGILKGGKKMFCDFLFTNEHESFIRWLEHLETYSQKYIYENRSKWFENELEMHDIENSFTSPLKVYKSGKYYIVRTTVPTRLGKCSLKIYDEQENDIECDQIQDSTSVMTIWEIQGIKCSTRNFQIEMEVKQMMVVKPNKLFEKCILTSFRQNGDPETKTDSLGKDGPVINPTVDMLCEKINGELDQQQEKNEYQYEDEEEEEDEDEDEEEEGSPVEILEIQGDLDESSLNPETILEKTNPLEIVELDTTVIEDDADMQLKNRNDVYYEIYMDAKKKAEDARNLAILAYLEAKRIKDLYKIKDSLESFTDFHSDATKKSENE